MKKEVGDDPCGPSPTSYLSYIRLSRLGPDSVLLRLQQILHAAMERFAELSQGDGSHCTV